jgi:hypothetical protein
LYNFDIDGFRGVCEELTINLKDKHCFLSLENLLVVIFHFRLLKIRGYSLDTDLVMSGEFNKGQQFSLLDYSIRLSAFKGQFV